MKKNLVYVTLSIVVLASPSVLAEGKKSSKTVLPTIRASETVVFDPWASSDDTHTSKRIKSWGPFYYSPTKDPVKSKAEDLAKESARAKLTELCEEKKGGELEKSVDKFDVAVSCNYLSGIPHRMGLTDGWKCTGAIKGAACNIPEKEAPALAPPVVTAPSTDSAEESTGGSAPAEDREALSAS